MKPAEWNETCSLAPANHEAGPEQQSETDLLRARVAQLEEALREQLGYTPGGPCQLPLIPKCICEKCKNDRARAALSGSSSDWLEAVKREAIVAELTRMANMGDEQIAALAAVIQRQDHKLAMWRDTFEAIDEDDMEASAHNALSAVYDLTDDAEAQDAADSILASLKQRMKAEACAIERGEVEA